MNLTSPVIGFAKGFWYPFNSFAFIRKHPTLYPFVILPFLINVISFSLVVYFCLGFYREQVMARIPQGEAWYWLILNYFLLLLAIVVVMVLIFFSFAAVGSLLASPFNDILSEKTERLLGREYDRDPFACIPFLEAAGRTMANEAKKIVVFLLGMVALLFVHLVPLLGTLLYPLLSVGWTIFFLVVEYTGYVFSRRQMSFGEQRQVIYQHTALMSGFGLGLFCLLTIPFVQFFCIPLGVVGAVRLLADLQEIGPKPSQLVRPPLSNTR